jgi:hypothetical protein
MPAKSEIKVWKVGEDTFVSDELGQQYKVQGYGSMKDLPLDLDPRIDLTQPIYDQAKQLAAEDEQHEGEEAIRKNHQATAA